MKHCLRVSFFFFFFLLFIWVCWVLVAAHGIFDLPCGMWDLFFFFPKLGYVAVECGILVPRLGIEPEALVMEAWNLNHWTTREVQDWGLFRAGRCLNVPCVSLPQDSVSSPRERGDEHLPGLGRLRADTPSETVLLLTVAPQHPSRPHPSSVSAASGSPGAGLAAGPSALFSGSWCGVARSGSDAPGTRYPWQPRPGPHLGRITRWTHIFRAHPPCPPSDPFSDLQSGVLLYQVDDSGPEVMSSVFTHWNIWSKWACWQEVSLFPFNRWRTRGSEGTTLVPCPHETLASSISQQGKGTEQQSQ